MEIYVSESIEGAIVEIISSNVWLCSSSKGRSLFSISVSIMILSDPPPFLSASIHEKESDACSKCDNYGLCLGIGCPFEKQVCKNFHQRLESVRI